MTLKKYNVHLIMQITINKEYRILWEKSHIMTLFNLNFVKNYTKKIDSLIKKLIFHTNLQRHNLQQCGQ